MKKLITLCKYSFSLALVTICYCLGASEIVTAVYGTDMVFSPMVTYICVGMVILALAQLYITHVFWPINSAIRNKFGFKPLE